MDHVRFTCLIGLWTESIRSSGGVRAVKLDLVEKGTKGALPVSDLT